MSLPFSHSKYKGRNTLLKLILFIDLLIAALSSSFLFLSVCICNVVSVLFLHLPSLCLSIQTLFILLLLSVVPLYRPVLWSAVEFQPWRGSLTCKTLVAHLLALSLIIQPHAKPQPQLVFYFRRKHLCLSLSMSLFLFLVISAHVNTCVFVHACLCKCSSFLFLAFSFLT